MIFPPCADFRLTFAFRVDRHADPAVPDGDVLWQPGKPDGHKQVAGGAGKVDGAAVFNIAVSCGIKSVGVA